MLMRTDPFRELDRLREQLMGTPARPAAMPMDAYERGGALMIHFDLPGVNPDSIDVSVEQNMLTVRAERPAPDAADVDMVVAERPRGMFSRQLFLGENLQMDRIEARYDAGVLTMRIPVVEEAKARKIEIAKGQGSKEIPA